MTYLAIQNTYEEVQIALCVENNIVARIAINKMYASAQCIPALDKLLIEHQLKLSDIAFIVANCGPGPFTTLRVVLATVNGIQMASAIPLIGIDSLDALLQEYGNQECLIACALLNAFNQDVYYATADARNNTYKKGCQNIDSLLAELAHTYPEQLIQFVGNGALLYQDRITHMFGSYACLPTPARDTCSLDQIQRMGIEAWRQGNYQTTPLSPHYLKSASPFAYPGPQARQASADKSPK